MQEIRNIRILDSTMEPEMETLSERIVFDAEVASNPWKSTRAILHDKGLLNLEDITDYHNRADYIGMDVTSVIYDDCKINFIWDRKYNNHHGRTTSGLIIINEGNQAKLQLLESLQTMTEIIVLFDMTGKTIWCPDNAYAELRDSMSLLRATNEQLQFKSLYCIPREGWMSDDWKKYTKPKLPFLFRTITLPDIYRKQRATENFTLLLDTILKEVPAAPVLEGSVKMQIWASSSESCSGLVTRGRLREGQTIFLHRADGSVTERKVEMLMTFFGNGRIRADEVQCGDVCSVFFQPDNLSFGLRDLISISGEP